MGTNLDNDDDASAEKSEASAKSNAEDLPPVIQLASALHSGIETSAASMGNREEGGSQFQESTAMLQRQHEPTRRFREMQLQLLKRFVDRQ